MLWGRVGGGRWSGCGGGGVAVAVAAGRGWLRFLLRVLSSTWWSMSLLCRSSTWDCPALGQGCLAHYGARHWFWSRQCSPGIPQLQFLDKVVTCPLLRRQVHLGFEVQKTVEIPQLQLVEFFDQVVDISVVVQRQIPMVLFRKP